MGVYYVDNARTQKRMPLYYQLYENYIKNEERLSIKKTLEKFRKPYLILHGSEDPAVPLAAAEYLAKNASKSVLEIIKGANHVFGGSHPFNETNLPKDTLIVVENSLTFLNS